MKPLTQIKLLINFIPTVRILVYKIIYIICKKTKKKVKLRRLMVILPLSPYWKK